MGWHGASGVETLPGVTDIAGVSQGLAMSGGRLTVVQEEYNPFARGVLVAGSSADQSTGFQTALNAVADAGTGILRLTSAFTVNGEFAVPSCSSFAIEGTVQTLGPVYEQAGSVIAWGGDVSVGPPHTSFAIDFTAVENGVSIRNLAAYINNAPRFGGGSYGVIPNVLCGFKLPGGSIVDTLSMSGFGSCLGYGGSGISSDHTFLDRFYTSSCGFGIDLLSGANTDGDQYFTNTNIQASCAAFAIASSHPGLGGGKVEGGYLAPIGFLRYLDGVGTGGGSILSVPFRISTEFAVQAAFWDEWIGSGGLGGAAGSGGNFFNNTFQPGAIYTAPQVGSAGWGPVTRTVSASSGTSLTLAESSGFYHRPGMLVTGTGVPANTYVLSVNTAWPYSSGTVNLTLNNSVTSPSSVSIGIPYVAAICWGDIASNHFFGNNTGYGSADSNGLAILCASGLIDNGFDDASNARLKAVNGPLMYPLNYLQNIGNSFGLSDAVSVGSGVLSGSCSYGDILQTALTGGSQVTQANGTGKVLGAALRSASSGASIDFVKTAMDDTPYGSFFPVTVNNKGSSTIAANTLIKVDTANPGGVTAASSMSDGQVIGISDNAAITGGSSGTARRLWCPV